MKHSSCLIRYFRTYKLTIDWWYKISEAAPLRSQKPLSRINQINPTCSLNVCILFYFAGDKGDAGLSGVGLPGDKGDRGSEGQAGARGKDGEKGERGADGAPGPPGPTGPRGDAGKFQWNPVL